MVGTVIRSNSISRIGPGEPGRGHLASWRALHLRLDVTARCRYSTRTNRGNQQQGAERVGDEARQQQDTRDHQAEGFEHLGDRQRHAELSPCPPQHGETLVAHHEGGDHRGEHDQHQGRPTPMTPPTWISSAISASGTRMNAASKKGRAEGRLAVCLSDLRII